MKDGCWSRRTPCHSSPQKRSPRECSTSAAAVETLRAAKYSSATSFRLEGCTQWWGNFLRPGSPRSLDGTGIRVQTSLTIHLQREANADLDTNRRDAERLQLGLSLSLRLQRRLRSSLHAPRLKGGDRVGLFGIFCLGADVHYRPRPPRAQIIYVICECANVNGEYTKGDSNLFPW